LRDFDQWLGQLPHRTKLLIAGNHDFCFQRQPLESRAAISNAIYLEDSGVEIDGLAFYGSPWQPWFLDFAFNLKRGADIRAKWELIPANTSVLVTHGPPRGIGDKTFRGDHAGCDDLLDIVRVVRPSLHLFGHIHEGYGETRERGTRFVNASICGFPNLVPLRAPILVTL
jgi:Icc-related predicted phosphoesterase